MKTPLTCIVASVGLGLLANLTCFADDTTAAAAKPAVPHIVFQTNFFDFGKVTSSEKLKGSFKFKNTGKAELQLDSPQASCDCTEAKITPQKLAPGESGEVTYSIKMDHAVSGQRYIKIHSNDPENPDLELTIQLDYTPLFETTPPKLDVLLRPGKDQVQTTFLVTRMDGKPLGIDLITASQEWIKAELDPTYDPQPASAFDTAPAHPETTGRVIVTVKRPPADAPTFFKEKVELWNGQQSDHSAKIVELNGQIQGEITADPARMDWVFPDFGNDIKAYSDQARSRHIRLVSALGKPVEFKKVSTDIKGMSVKIVPIVAKRNFDLIVQFDQVPHDLIDGTVTLETSLESLPKLQIPLHISAAP